MASKQPPRKKPAPAGAVFRLNQIPRRPARVICPAPYAPLWVDVWANPPARLIREATPTMAVYDFLAPLVLGWNLSGADGTVLPCDAATIAELPLDLQTYLLGEAQRLINQPLAEAAD